MSRALAGPAARLSKPAIAVAAGLAVIAVAAAFLARGRQPAVPESGQAADRKATAYTGREALDTSAWPALGHDMRRSAQGHLSGPATAASVRLLYQSDVPLSWDAGMAGKDLSPLVVRSDGAIVFGSCGSVTTMDLSGRVLWTRQLAEQPVREGVSGFTVAAGGVLLVATHECPAVASTRTHVYGLDGSGTPLWSRLVGETYMGPAIGIDGRWYSISDSNLLRTFAPPTVEPYSMTDLAGDRHGAIAMDSRGNLYVGTNGGEYHRPSLWSLASDGAIRWSREAGALTTPVVTVDDRILVAGNGTLLCYEPGGTRLWARQIGSVADSVAPLAVARSGNAYALTTQGLVAVGPDGVVRWTIPPSDGPALSPGPILDKDENVYLALGNRVSSFTSDKTLRWTLPLTAPGPLIIAADGVLCVVSERRKIYAIGAPQGPAPTGSE